MSSIQWGMREPPLYYHSCASDGVWLFAAARAPHHMTRTGPVVPKKRRCLGLLVVGLGVALCELNFQGDYTHPKNESVWRETRGRVHCGVVRQHHER